jgi:hypothetical protein
MMFEQSFKGMFIEWNFLLKNLILSYRHKDIKDNLMFK